MDAILEQFLTEARDNLAYLDKHLEELKDGDTETINALFRAAHTLKGGAGLVGAVPVKELTHSAEDLLDAYRQGKIEFSEEMLENLYDAFDEVIEMIDAMEEIGGVEIEVDNERIEHLKKSVRGLIEHNPQNIEVSQTTNQKLETSLNIDNSLNTEQFNTFQIQKLSRKIPIEIELTREFLDTPNYWIVNLDLDSESVTFGNDPIYLFTLLENQDFEVVVKCNGINEDNLLEWNSLLTCAIKSTETEFEDVFYNVFEDLTFKPLTIKSLFETNYPNLDNETFEEFQAELTELIQNKEFAELDEKLSAITQVINSESKEGFVLTRLQAILTNFHIGSEEYIKVLKLALNELNLNIEIEISKNEIKEEKGEEIKESGKIELDEKTKNSVLNILKTQQKVLKVAHDSHLLDRTKMLLKNVLGFLNIDEDIESLKEVEELKTFIDTKIGEIEGATQPIVTKKVENKEKQVNQTENKEETEKHTTTHHHERSAIGKTVKIEQSQIDDLMDIVGEILVVKNAIPYVAENLRSDNVENSKRELFGKYEEISRIIEQLQDRVMQMRLLPVEYIFGRYPKLVRDISKKLGKKIKYIEKGGDTKLDKTMIEKLADPLVHIIRNSLDHGIETPEIRKEKGKPEEGILEVSAKSEGDKVFITIKDDGAGIDLEKVINKVLEKGLIEADSIDKMDREEKLKLIFLPGLSTKDEITDLSGRGVGTDAVKKTIEELGGKIKLKSETDVGTELTLELPVSVALTNVFHILMNKINYAIAMDYVVETTKVLKSEIQTANHNPFINIRGELVPILFESCLLGDDTIKEENSIVILTFNNKKVGLVVDEFVGQLDVVQKPLSGAIKNHPLITGTSLLGNGDVLFVLDVKKLIGGDDE
jgi:two-component system chemotaxis sensor kinase CheA